MTMEEKAGRCVWCDGYFTWTPSGPKDVPKLYCTKSHAEKAREANKKFMSHFPEGVCPTPWKVKHRTSPEAAQVLVTQLVRNGSAPYLCNCGSFHLGRPKRGGWTEERPPAKWRATNDR